MRTKQAVAEAVRGRRAVRRATPTGQVLAKPGQPLEAEQIDLLRAGTRRRDRVSGLRRLHWPRGGRDWPWSSLLFLLCGVHMRYRQRGPLASLARLIVHPVAGRGRRGAGPLGRPTPWRAELVPLLLFGMTMAIVYRQELALLLSGVLA